MRIKMLRTENGSENGIIIQQYIQDQYYDVGDKLGNAFVSAGFALHADDANALDVAKPARVVSSTSKQPKPSPGNEKVKGNAPTASAGNRSDPDKVPTQDIWE